MIPFLQCIVCKNLTDENKKICKAFPKGIPDALWSGAISHEQKFKGDNGIRFAAVEEIKK